MPYVCPFHLYPVDELVRYPPFGLAGCKEVEKAGTFEQTADLLGFRSAEGCCGNFSLKGNRREPAATLKINAYDIQNRYLFLIPTCP